MREIFISDKGWSEIAMAKESLNKTKQLPSMKAYNLWDHYQQKLKSPLSGQMWAFWNKIYWIRNSFSKFYAFMQCNEHLKIFKVTNLYKDNTTLFMSYGTIDSQIFKEI